MLIAAMWIPPIVAQVRHYGKFRPEAYVTLRDISDGPVGLSEPRVRISI
jgi:hypothetical protein